MNEIKCPKCGTLFKIDENEYAKVIKQIRDNEFEKELKIRDELNTKEKESAIKLNEMSLKEKYNTELAKKDLEINDLKNKIKLKENETQLAVKEEQNKSEKEINDLRNKLELKENEYLLKEKMVKDSYQEKLKDKDEQIAY